MWALFSCYLSGSLYGSVQHIASLLLLFPSYGKYHIVFMQNYTNEQEPLFSSILAAIENLPVKKNFFWLMIFHRRAVIT